jgi:hypothetical protein
MGLSGPAQALTINVVPWLAPNVYGSPSFPAAETNAVTGMENGGVATGTPNTPSYFAPTTNVTAAQVIVTGFPSWLGMTDPGTVYGPGFANELGNRMTFALSVLGGPDDQFSISDLSFVMDSNDPGNGLDWSWGAGSYNYGSGYLGVLYGGDGVLGGGDDTYVTSGPSNQLVDALFGRGSGNSFDAYCAGCSVADQQAALLAAAAYPGTPFDFTGTYYLGAASGSATFHISPVPLPSALLFLGSGLVGLGVLARWRKKSGSLALA